MLLLHSMLEKRYRDVGQLTRKAIVDSMLSKEEQYLTISSVRIEGVGIGRWSSTWRGTWTLFRELLPQSIVMLPLFLEELFGTNVAAQDTNR
ncbi:hypothetical protein V6N13_048753 [Hibiscus sabdariffa]